MWLIIKTTMNITRMLFYTIARFKPLGENCLFFAYVFGMKTFRGSINIRNTSVRE